MEGGGNRKKKEGINLTRSLLFSKISSPPAVNWPEQILHLAQVTYVPEPCRLMRGTQEEIVGGF